MRRRRTARGGWELALLLIALSRAAAQPLDVLQPLLLALTGSTLVQTGTPPVRQAPGVRSQACCALLWSRKSLAVHTWHTPTQALVLPGSGPARRAHRQCSCPACAQNRRRLAQQSEPGARCAVCGAVGSGCGCVGAAAHAAGYQCTPEAAAQAAAVCAQLPPDRNLTATAANFAARAPGASFAAGDWSGAAGSADSAAARAFTFYGQCVPPPPTVLALLTACCV